MKNKLFIFLSSILLGVSSIFVPLFSKGTNSARAITNSDTTSYVTVNELWDSTNKKVNKENLLTLFDYVSGTLNTQFNTIEQLAEGKLTSKDMRANALSSYNGTAIKEEGKDIVVTLGGLKWQVVYLSDDKNGNPILTLWLANTSEVNVTSIRFADAGNAGAYEVDRVYVEIPSSLYGSSKIRTEMLNAGGYKATSATTVVEVEQDSSNVFADFTMPVDGEYNDLTDFITTPEYVEWQEFQRAKDYGLSGNNLSNEAWSNELTNEGFYGAAHNFAGRTYNDVWKTDYIWLPSSTEIGAISVEKGIWEPSLNQKKSDALYLTRSVSSNKDWTSNATDKFAASGDSSTLNVANSNLSGGLRPALHLNLSALVEKMESQETTTNTKVYLDPVNGNDNSSGLTEYMAVKSLDVAENKVENNGEIVVMNPIEITEDYVLGFSKAYTLKRYYKNATLNYQGVMLTIGVYDTADATNNKCPTVVLDNVVIDGNATKASAFDARDGVIDVVNGELYFEDGSGLKNHNGCSASISGVGNAIELYNGSNIVINGGTFDKNYNFDVGTIIRNRGTGKVIINDGVFTRNHSNLWGMIISKNVEINGGVFGGWTDINEDGVFTKNESLGNSAHNNGIIVGDVDNLTINGGTFYYNFMEDGGGSTAGSLFLATNIIVNGGTFKDNYDNSSRTNTFGGGVFNVKSSIEINGGLFENNESFRCGGVIYMYSGWASKTKAVIKNATFKGNHSKIGGVIFVDKNSSAAGTIVEIENCIFEDNYSNGNKTLTLSDGVSQTYNGGGVIYAIGADVTIKNSTFTNNTSNGDGGAIQVIDGGTLTVYDCDFINNDTTGSFGGAIAQGKNSIVKVYSSYFDDNDAGSCSGAIDGGTAVDCIFKNSNSANGGAVRSVSCTNCEFYNNTATISGGALYSGSVNNCYFEGNSAGQNGGAIAYPIQVSNCEFVNNSSSGTGGAISIPDASWYSDAHNIGIKNSSFIGNTAGSYGGAIYANKGSITLTNVSITDNFATTNGGGVYFSTVTGEAKIYFGTTKTQNKIVIEDNTKTGGEDSNLFLVLNESFPTIEIVTNLEEGSSIYVESSATLVGKKVAQITGSTKYLTQQTIDAFKSTENLDFYALTLSDGSSKTGVGLLADTIVTNNTVLSYIASDNYCDYDGLEHTINIEVYSSVGNYYIFYSDAEDGEYSTTPITVREPGESKVVWFYLTDESGDVYFPESREVKISRMDIVIAESIVINTVLGAEFIKDEILPVTMSGKVVDALGNAVAVDLVYLDPTITVNYAANNMTFMVNVVPKNTEKYNTLKSVSVKVNISYDNLYFKNNTFYLDSTLATEGSFTTSDANLSQVLTLLNNNSTIYFLSSYSVNSTMTLETDNNIYFSRLITDNGSLSSNILSIAPPANITIGSHNMKGRITITGGDTSYSKSATVPLISVNGTTSVLNIVGNVIIEGAKLNKDHASNIYGAGISNTGILNIDGAIFKNLNTRGNGGAIYNAGTLVAKNTTIEACRGVHYGTGIYSTGNITLENCTISNNLSDYSGNAATCTKGVGIAVVGDVIVKIDNCRIINNVINSTSNKAMGGGIYVGFGVEATINNTLIGENNAYWCGSGLYADPNTNVVLNNVDFYFNRLEGIDKASGIAIYVAVDAYVHFVSGKMELNHPNTGNSAATRACVYVRGTFDFGELNSDNAKMIGDNEGNKRKYAGAVYVDENGVFNMYGGAIEGFQSSYTYCTIYIAEKAKAYIYSGRLFNNTTSYPPNSYNGGSVYHVLGDLYINTKVFVNNTIGVNLNEDRTPNIHLFGNVYDLYLFNFKFCYVKNAAGQYINGKIFEYDTELSGKSLTEEEWEYLISKIGYNNPTATIIGSSTIEYVYDNDANQYYAYLNPQKASNFIYFDPENGNDGKDGTTAANALLTWNMVLTKASTGSSVYLCNIWNIDATTTINGAGIKLLRTSSLTTYMFNITTANVTLTINNLIIDGRKNFNNAEYAEDYLLAKAVIYSEKSCTINLNDTTIQNNATATSGNAIHLKVNGNTTKFDLNLNNTTIKDNTIYTTAKGKYMGVGIYVENTTNTHTNPEVNINIKNSDISNNTIINEYKSGTLSNSGQIANSTHYGINNINGGVGVAFNLAFGASSAKTINFNAFNTTFESNLIENPTYYGGVALLVCATGTGNDTNVVNINTNKCEFINNGTDYYLASGANNTNVGAVGLYLEGAVKTSTKFIDTNFYDNKGFTSTFYISSTKNGNSINFDNCAVDNSNLVLAPNVTIYTSITGVDSIVEANNCTFIKTQIVFRVYNTGNQVTIKAIDCYFENNNYLFYLEKTDCYISNSNSYNASSAFYLKNSNIYGDNTVLDTGSGNAIECADSYVKNISGLTISNYAGHGVVKAQTNTNNTLNISNLNISKVKYAFNIQFGSANLTTSNTNQNVVNINSCNVKDVERGIYFAHYLYTTTSTTCTVKLNVNNSTFQRCTEAGIYIGAALAEAVNYVQSNINLKNTTIKDSAKAILDNYSQVKTYVLDGGYFINNTYGIYAKKRIEFKNVVALNNTTYDVYAETAIYMSGKNNIGTMYCISTATTTSIFLTGAISKYKDDNQPINIKLSVATAVGLMVVGVDSGYTPVQADFDAFLPLFSVYGATLSTSGSSIVISALDASGAEIGSVEQANVYYFDPANATGVASASANGKTINAPFLNLDQVLAKANSNVTVYIMSNCTIAAGTYDFKDMTFKVYFNSANAMPYMTSQYILSTSGTTVIKNLTLDCNRTDGNNINGVDFYNNTIINVGRSLSNKRILYFNGATLTLDGVTVQNAYQTEYLLHLNGTNTVMNNCKFYNIYDTGLGSYLQTSLTATNLEMVNVNHGFYFNNNNTRTFTNCYFENCNYTITMRYQLKATFTTCEFVNCYRAIKQETNTYSGNVIFDDCLIDNCGYVYYNNGNFAAYDKTRYTDDHKDKVTVKNSVITNVRNSAFYIYAGSSASNTYYYNGLLKLENTNIDAGGINKIIDTRNIEVRIVGGTISNAVYGAYINGGSIYLSDYATISDCDYGIYGLTNTNININKAEIKNNKTGIFTNGRFTLLDGEISNNSECAINSDNAATAITIAGGIIDNTNGVISKDYGGSKNLEYSIYTPGTITIYGNPIITAPIIANGFANSNIPDSTTRTYEVYRPHTYSFEVLADGTVTAENLNVHNTYSIMILKPLKDTTFSFEYIMNLEKDYDMFFVFINNKNELRVHNKNTTTYTSFSREVKKGDEIRLLYYKDTSKNGVDSTGDVLTLRNFSAAADITNSLTTIDTSSTISSTREATSDYYATKSGSYTFVERSDGAIIPNNTFNHSTTSDYSIVATKSFTINLNYLVDTELNCDWFRIYYNGTEVVKTCNTSGAFVNYTQAMNVGDTLKLHFTVDSSKTVNSNLVIITGLDYIEPIGNVGSVTTIAAPTILLGELSAGSKVRFVVPDNVGAGDIIGSAFGSSFDSARANAIANAVYVDGWTDTSYISGSKVGVQLGSTSSEEIDWGQDIGSALYVDPIYGDDNNSGRTSSDALATLAGFNAKNTEGKYHLVIMNNIKLTTSITLNMNGKTISRYYFSSSAYNTGDYCITVSNSAVLTLNDANIDGSYIVNGSEAVKKSAFIYLNNGAKLIYNNGEAYNCYSVATGGVIRSLSCEVVLNGVKFTGNKSTGGGAIYIENSTLTVNNCWFENNTNSNTADGGAISIKGSSTTSVNKLIINNSTFIGNSTYFNSKQGFGGAIYAKNNTEVDIDGCLFRDNDAYKNGGAIRAESVKVFNLTNSVFEDNKLRYKDNWGTAIAVGGSALTTTVYIDGCEFNNHDSAVDDRYVLSIDVSGDVTVKNTQFKNNEIKTGVLRIANSVSASGKSTWLVENIYIKDTQLTRSITDEAYKGSAIRIDQTKRKDDVIIKDCIFENNAHTFHSSVMFYFNIMGSLTFDNTKIVNNMSNINGEWLTRIKLADSAILNIINTVIKNNTAYNSNGSGGILQVMMSNKNTINCENLVVENNTAARAAWFGIDGADASRQHKINFIGGSISNNTKNGTSDVYGLGIAFEDFDEFLMQGTILDGNYNKNYGTTNGVASFYNCNGEIKDIVVTNNTTQGAGLRFGSSAALQNSIVINNAYIANNRNTLGGVSGKERSGAGIYSRYYNDLQVNNSIIENNTTTGYLGTGILGVNSKVTLNNTIVRNNDTKTASLVIDESLIKNNVGFNDVEFVVEGANSVRGGGGISVYGGNLTVNGGEISGNTSTGLAGGIMAYAPVLLNGTKVYNNASVIGGGMILTSDSTIINSEIYNNYARDYAGAIWVGAKLTITNSKVYDNRTQGDGAGIYSDSEKSSLVIDGVLFKNNTALGNGAGVYFENPLGSITLNNSEFVNNTSNWFGTALYSEIEVNIKNTKFVANNINGNSLIHYGYVRSATLENVAISGNFGSGEHATLFSFGAATNDGIPRFNIVNSAIYGNLTQKKALIEITNNLYLSILDSTVYGNVNSGEDGKGGLISVLEGTFKLENGQLANNFAANGASVYFANGTSGLFINSIITGHSNGLNNYCQNGAVYIDIGAEVKFINGEVKDNYASNLNGVIYNNGSLEMTGTAVYNNLTNVGSVYNASAGIASFNNVDIYENIANKGAGIANFGIINFVSGEITSNIAVDTVNPDTSITYGEGGGVYNGDTGIFTLTDGEISSNTAGHGGGVYNNGQFILNNGLISNNFMTHSGGGIYNHIAGQLVVNGGSISYNCPATGATSTSGFGVANAGSLVMNGGEISNNYTQTTSTSFASSKGGAVYGFTSSSHTRIIGGKIVDNAAELGAGIYIESGAVLDIYDVTIDNETRLINAKIYGRAIYSNGSTVNLINATIKSTASTTSNNGYGSIYAQNSSVNISDCEFIANKENYGIVTCIGGSLFITNSVFENNQTQYDVNVASGIINIEDVNCFNIEDSNFINNKTNGNGVLRLKITNKYTGAIDNCSFVGNTALKNGGAIAIFSETEGVNNSELTISNTTFTKNSAGNSGGAIYVNGGNGTVINLLNTVFGGWIDLDEDGYLDENEESGNIAGVNGGAICIAANETSPVSVVIKGEIEISYNKANVGGGIYYAYSNPTNTAENYYNLHLESGLYAIIAHNSGAKGENNLHMLDSADLNILSTGLTEGSSIGVTLVKNGTSEPNVGDIIIKSYNSNLPLNSTDFKAFYYDMGQFGLKLDSNQNQIVLVSSSYQGSMIVNASDVVYGLDGKYKTVTSEDIIVIGTPNYTVTFAKEENGVFTENAPKYMAKGNYTIWYKVVNNNNPVETVKGSLTLKITGKILVIKEAPTASLNKGESLSQATFKGGMAISNGSSVSGTWAFAEGSTQPSDTTQKYKLVFTPFNDDIYENEASIYVNINISYYKVYYYSDGTTAGSGFFTDREHLISTGIKSLSEMVSCMQDNGAIFFMSTYIVGSSGVTEENVLSNKKVFISRYALHKDTPIISLPENASTLKLSLGGGSGEIIIEARHGYAAYNETAPLFENYGILILNSNVSASGFINTAGEASIVKNYGQLYLNGCQIYNNRSTSTTVNCKGGAIANYGEDAVVYFNGGDYRLNNTQGNTTYYGFGGFMYNEGGTVVINSGFFVRNGLYANAHPTYGGFLYTDGGEVIINGGEIMFNYAWNGYGGAIYATNNAEIKLNGGRILINLATKGGAGIYIAENTSEVVVNGGEIKFNVLSSANIITESVVSNEKQEVSVFSVIANIASVIICLVLIVFSVYFYLPKSKKFKIKK